MRSPSLMTKSSFEKLIQNNTNLSSIIGINRTRRIENPYSLFNASPLRGRIWASYPSGSSIYNPVGIRYPLHRFKYHRFIQVSTEYPFLQRAPYHYSGQFMSRPVNYLYFNFHNQQFPVYFDRVFIIENPIY